VNDRLSDRRPHRLPLRRLVAELAGALGRPEAAVLGAPVAIDLRWRHDERGLFMSGVTADLVDQVGAVFAAVFDDCDGVVAEWWSVARGRGIGTGPVLVDDDVDIPTITAHKLVQDERDEQEAPTRLEQAQELRTRFAIAAARLEASFAVPLDAGLLLAVIDGEPVAAAAVLDDIADSRRLVGRYLLDAADELDDERVDQLGDGYLRSADLWAALAGPDPNLADPDLIGQLLGLERSCVEWMLGAAELPTRYAF